MKRKQCHDGLPLGFKAAGLSCGIKKSGKKDLALFYSEYPCAVAALVTINRFQAAPVRVSLRQLKAGNFCSRAIIVNSGNANCATGPQGLQDARAMCILTAKLLGLRRADVLVSSTGVIGVQLPYLKIKQKLPFLVKSLSLDGLADAAEAIRTTDRFAKTIVKKVKIGTKSIMISGVAKGAGMIAPSMKSATMLAFILTDAVINKARLKTALKKSVDASFNSISVDGCMSTNDMVVAMANGSSQSSPLVLNSKEGRVFQDALNEICLRLAQMIVEDGEGATKLIEVRIQGAKNKSQARRLARSVADSNLVKCAMFASDPNWGRIVAACGSVLSSLDPKKTDIFINGVCFLKKGRPCSVKRENLLRKRLVKIEVSLNIGRAKACFWASDLSYDYIKINSHYN